MLIGYTLDALLEAGCERIFEEFGRMDSVLPCVHAG